MTTARRVSSVTVGSADSRVAADAKKRLPYTCRSTTSPGGTTSLGVCSMTAPFSSVVRCRTSMRLEALITYRMNDSATPATTASWSGSSIVRMKVVTSTSRCTSPADHTRQHITASSSEVYTETTKSTMQT